MKKRLFGLAVIAICLSVIGAGTLAFFTASDTAHNVITSGQVEINLIEQCVEDGALVTFADAHENNTITGVMPGREISKIVKVENTGLSKAWVRIKLEKSITGADGEDLPADVMDLDLSNDWVKDPANNGYYYYTKPLDPKVITPEADKTQQDAEGQPEGTTAMTPLTITQTVPLFTTVTFDRTMGNEYQGCTAVINVTAEATQYANNEADHVLKVVGWPGQFDADEDGDDIIPPVNSDDNKADNNETKNEGGNA